MWHSCWQKNVRDCEWLITCYLWFTFIKNHNKTVTRSASNWSAWPTRFRMTLILGENLTWNRFDKVLHHWFVLLQWSRLWLVIVLIVNVVTSTSIFRRDPCRTRLVATQKYVPRCSLWMAERRRLNGVQIKGACISKSETIWSSWFSW